jgi:ectoine hydroxylase-related dioxygenase (phytanoyl-CoA dioxygenase family)
MLTDEQRYLFDLQGFLVLENMLDKDRIARMQKDMDAKAVDAPDKDSLEYRWGDFLTWGKDWADLIDHPRVMAAMEEMLGPKFRLDHAYGMAMKASNQNTTPGNLHHEGGMFHHGCFYAQHGAKMHNGLMVVSWALTDAPAGSGGFICIPGSHKATYPMSRQWYNPADPRLQELGLVKNLSLNAGDVLIFTEALTHGTNPWTNTKNQRRSVLLKYCPHYMQWAEGVIKGDDSLTDNQKLLIKKAYVWQREAVDLNQPNAEPAKV